MVVVDVEVVVVVVTEHVYPVVQYCELGLNKVVPVQL